MTHATPPRTEETANWRRSSHSASGADQNCVEAAFIAEQYIAIRDSKQDGGPWLLTGRPEWKSVLHSMSQGLFDR